MVPAPYSVEIPWKSSPAEEVPRKRFRGRGSAEEVLRKKLSRYSVVPLSRCPVVLLRSGRHSRCPVVPLSCCDLPLSRCPVVPLSCCDLAGTPVIPLSRCPVVMLPFGRYSVVPLSRCHVLANKSVDPNHTEKNSKK